MQRVVIKLGTTTLTRNGHRVNWERIAHLVAQVGKLHEQGVQVLIVSSGAIGTGMGMLGLHRRPESITELQALSCLGQPKLFAAYALLLEQEGIFAAQVLVTGNELRARRENTKLRNTLEALLEMDAIPIINENDAVSSDEIEMGDNDTLSAYLATTAKADLLVILSDVDGLYNEDPRENPEATLVRTVQHAMLQEILTQAEQADSIRHTREGELGTGRMVTKLKAAQIVTRAGIPMVLTNGAQKNVVLRILRGENIGTTFQTS